MGGRAIIVVTSPLALDRILGGQVRFLVESGFDVTVACGEGPAAARFARSEGVRVDTLPLCREISPVSDARALLGLYKLFRDERPQIVHVGTPKAGLLGGLAAWLAGVPVRIYTIHGLRLETASGVRRLILWAAEWLSCRLARTVVCVSPSVRNRAVEMGLMPSDKALVLGPGSANGAPLSLVKSPVRRSGEIRTLGFVGRLTADKGIADLVEVFERLQATHPYLRLLLVGDFESGDPVGQGVRERIVSNPSIDRVGFVREPWEPYRNMDLLLLPSYREGFPGVLLEAGVFSLPVVGYAATGTVDAVVDGKTGLLAPVGDTAGLGCCVRRLLGDPSLARCLGAAGRDRVIREFEPTAVWDRLAGLYSAEGQAVARKFGVSIGKRGLSSTPRNL